MRQGSPRTCPSLALHFRDAQSPGVCLPSLLSLHNDPGPSRHRDELEDALRHRFNAQTAPAPSSPAAASGPLPLPGAAPLPAAQQPARRSQLELVKPPSDSLGDQLQEQNQTPGREMPEAEKRRGAGSSCGTNNGRERVFLLRSGSVRRVCFLRGIRRALEALTWLFFKQSVTQKKGFNL